MFLFARVLVVALTPLLIAPPDAAAGERDPRLVSALRDLVRSEGGPPGVIAVIQRGADRTVYTAGTAIVAASKNPFLPEGSRVPLRVNDHLRIASVSKTFSGASALALVTEGRLSLNDTIGKRLPDLPPQWHPVTLRQLLNHTSGLPDFAASPGFARRVNAKPADPPSPRRLLSFVADKPLSPPFGSPYRYSNSDNIVVGLMVAAVSGESYPATLRRKVLDPLRLSRTRLSRNINLPTPFIHGYAFEEDGTPVDVSEVVDFGGYAWASGGIVSTESDLTRFVRAYVGGRLFGTAARAEQFRFLDGAASSPPGPGRNAAGLALFRYITRCGTVYGHTGSILGYTHLVAATRDGRTSLTFAVNTQLDEEAIAAVRRVQELAVCVALGQ